MNEAILKSLIRLFAIIANVNEEGISLNARTIIEAYLKSQLNINSAPDYLKFFDECLRNYHHPVSGSEFFSKQANENEEKIKNICRQINAELEQAEKQIVLIRLIEFIHEDSIISTEEANFIRLVADSFNISDSEFELCKAFIYNNINDFPEKERILIVNDKFVTDSSRQEDLGQWFEQNKPESVRDFRHIYRENLKGQFVIIHLHSTNLFVAKYLGSEPVSLNGLPLISQKAYIVNHGAIIRSRRFSPIYYTDIAGKFHVSSKQSYLSFQAKNIEFRFPNSDNGLYPFNFEAGAGNLVGIMGGSGVGKSTLLNVFNGKLPLTSGEILINGYSLEKDQKKLEGVIGFVPQDDLLIDELTVFQNLYFNAKLCFNNFSEKQIHAAVQKLLEDLDLSDIKHLKVGNPLNKFISGGQRKRLNIALELIREPAVLFVDEPTSGLSSMDSEKVMLMLKELTLKGKLVLLNIHQPSSDIFKLFDKLVILDKGGRPIYQGNPIDAISYFKHRIGHVNADESECAYCGNVNPEQILQIVEAKEVDEYGKLTNNRKVTPGQWYDLYLEHADNSQINSQLDAKTNLPRNFFRVPDRFSQFRVFLARNILAKLTNSQYILINLLEAPALAAILAYFTKFIEDGQYVFSENKNLPIYLFMSIVVALFIGMTVSAEEIIKDKRILQREQFLNLSRSSYITSKVFFLLLLSAFQSFTFVLVGNLILDIQAMLFNHWYILFTTAVFANLVGLNISSGLNSVITIYITIPFILVPQLLMGGAMVRFDELHPHLASDKYVPFIGDLMASRWAYEALAVTQFKDNPYERLFFDQNQKISEALFESAYKIPYLESRLDEIETRLKTGKRPENATDLNLIRHYLQTNKHLWEADFDLKTKVFDTEQLKVEHLETARTILKSVQSHFRSVKSKHTKVRDQKYESIIRELGKDEFLEFSRNFHNNRLAEFVQNKNQLEKLKVVNGAFINKKDPIYQIPDSQYGRAHFYAPAKRLGTKIIDTLWFNTGVIWLMSFVLYVALKFDWLRKLIDATERIKLRNPTKREALRQ